MCWGAFSLTYICKSFLNAYCILSPTVDIGDTEQKDRAPALGSHSLFRRNEQMHNLIITLSVVIKSVYSE